MSIYLPPKGTRIRLTDMPNDPDPIPVGTLGTVTGGVRMSQGMSQIWVRWDNGRTLNLIPAVDKYEIVKEAT